MRPPLPGVKPGMNPKPGQSQGVRPALQRQPTAEERRRAQRVLLRDPVLVHLKGRDKPIEGTTHTVSATGDVTAVDTQSSRGVLPCWIAVTKNGRFVYATNTGAGDVLHIRNSAEVSAAACAGNGRSAIKYARIESKLR